MGALRVGRNNLIARGHVPRDHRAGPQPSSTDMNIMIGCGCPFHTEDSCAFMHRSATIFSNRLSDQYAPPEPLYAHASSTQLPFPPETVSTRDRKNVRDAVTLSDDGGSFDGSSIDSYIMGHDFTLDASRDPCQPDIVTRHARSELEMTSQWRCFVSHDIFITALWMRWTRRVIRMRLTEWDRKLIPEVRCVLRKILRLRRVLH